MKHVTKLFVKLYHISIVKFILSSVLISIIFEKLPDSMFNYQKKIFQMKKWEEQGEIYNKIFKVKKWKDKVLELSDVIKSVFPKKHINTYSKDYLNKYLIQSCRAELAHITIILSTFGYALENQISTFHNMFILAVVLNLPYIIIQRFNRPRIIKYINRLNILHSNQAVLCLDSKS